MARPRIPRRINFEPNATYFKPAGVPLKELEEVVLSFEEAESIRLKDLVGLSQTTAAKKMNISQPTFYRILIFARKKIAEAVINGKAIKIQNAGTNKKEKIDL
ncbi:MAG: DUF134 domain-containing protein [Candidatus Iainarchaeum sp.]|jgi:predicted DNA-binding protein (UPF0251 family)|nr:MAG: hypothetical protein BWY55_00129 [archaeon ADurb.Bin336]